MAKADWSNPPVNAGGFFLSAGTNSAPVTCAKSEVIGMASKEREIYYSANGDRWFLCREGENVFVLHSANESSGGKLTPVELGDFFRKGNAGPEHQALRQMIGSLIDQQ